MRLPETAVVLIVASGKWLLNDPEPNEKSIVAAALEPVSGESGVAPLTNGAGEVSTAVTSNHASAFERRSRYAAGMAVGAAASFCRRSVSGWWTWPSAVRLKLPLPGTQVMAVERTATGLVSSITHTPSG